MPACSAWMLPQSAHSRADSDTTSDRGREATRALERSPELEQVPASEDRDPVEHDRRDHLVGADGRTEDPGDPTPDRSADDPRDEPEQHVQRPRGAFQVRPDPERGDEADPVLTLPSDVEEAAAERERDREPGQHQRRREDQSLLQVPRRARPV